MLSVVRLERSPLLPPPPLCVHCRASGETTSLRVLFLTVIAPTRGLFSSAFSVFTAHSCDSRLCRRLEKTLLNYSLPFSKHVPRSVPLWLICLVYSLLPPEAVAYLTCVVGRLPLPSLHIFALVFPAVSFHLSCFYSEI